MSARDPFPLEDASNGTRPTATTAKPAPPRQAPHSAPPPTHGAAAAPAPARVIAGQHRPETMDARTVEYAAFGTNERIKLTIPIVRDFLCTPTKSGALPDDAQVVRYMLLARARRLNPWEGDCFLIGYDTQYGPQFSLVTAHQAFLKRAEEHPEYDGMTSGVIVADQERQIIEREGDFFLDGETLLGGWATVYRRDRSYPTHRKLRLQSFHKGTKIWNENAAGMIVKCAEADALRSTFPQLLAGMYAQGEIEQTEAPTLPTVTKSPTAAETVKARLQHSQPATRTTEHNEDDQAADTPAGGNAAMREWMTATLRTQIAAARGPADLANARKAIESAKGMLGAEATETLLTEAWEARRMELATEGDAQPATDGEQAEPEPAAATPAPARRGRKPQLPREPGIEDEEGAHGT